MRKGSCTSAKAAFEPGDKTGGQRQPRAGRAPQRGATRLAHRHAVERGLGGAGLHHRYDRLGGRSVWFDSAGAGEIGFSEVTGLGDATFTLHENATTPAHLLVVVLPTAGAARLQ